MTSASTGKAFAVLFEELLRWDIGCFTNVGWKWPGSTLKPLSRVLTRKRSRLSREDYLNMPVIEKITFGGELVIDYLDKSEHYKGQLYIATESSLIYSKIRLKQGSVALIPKGTDAVAVSSEYPVYEVDTKVANPKYLVLTLRSGAFQLFLDGLSHGGSSKTRIHPDDFEKLTIPLPNLEMQNNLVRFIGYFQREVELSIGSIADTHNNLNKSLYDLYNSESSGDPIRARHFALPYKDLDAWDVKAGRASAFRLACPSFRPRGDFIEEATEMVRPSDDPEKEWPVYGVNNKNGVFLNSYQKGESFNAPYKRIRKDWFFHNPTRCNVGSLGIVPEVPEDAITSPEYQVWKLKEDVPEPLLPEFVATLIQTPFFLELVQFNRVGAVKQRMYTENLFQLRIPYLPVQEQKKYASARAKAISRLAKARERLELARQEVEEMIIGRKPVPEREICNST